MGYMVECSVTVMADSAVTPWTAVHQAVLSMGFSRQDYQSESQFPFPGDLPNPGTELVSFMSSELAGRFFTHCNTMEVG